MSTYQLGFIGTGNMGGALAQAAAKSGAGMLLSNRTADRPARARLHGGRRYDQDDQRNAGPPLPGRADHAESAGRAWEGRGSDLPGRYCYGG